MKAFLKWLVRVEQVCSGLPDLPDLVISDSALSSVLDSVGIRLKTLRTMHPQTERKTYEAEIEWFLDNTKEKCNILNTSVTQN